MFERCAVPLALVLLLLQTGTVRAAEYMGCYQDSESRVFPWEHIQTGDNSIKSCGLHCKKNGYIYFGVQYASHCFCGTDNNFANLGTARPDSDCNMPCSGNSAEMCGGSLRNSIYRPGRIANITASSYWGDFHLPTHARLDFKEVSGTHAGSWAPRQSNTDQWLMFDLGQRSTVGVLRTQGRQAGNYQWVTSYSVSYGNSSGDEMWYKDANGDTIVFMGNSDGSSLVTHVLTDYSGPFHARYVKFHPVTWYNFVSMRADVGEVAPVGFWPLNRHTQLRDVSGYGNDATDVGVSLGSGVHGESEGAYNFSGSSSSYIEITNNGALDTRYSVTILAYVYPTGTNGPIVNYRINNYGVHLWQIETNKLFVRMATRSHVFTNPISVATLNLNQWNFVGLTYSYSTGKVKAWHDGIEVGSLDVGTIETETQYDIRVGYLDGDARAFQGRIACIQIYNIPLNGDQIRDAAGKCRASQPVGLWPLNKQYGLTDTSGNGNDATGEGVALGTGVYGEPEGSYVLSGNSSSYIEIPNDRTLDTRYSLTILASVYPTGQSGPLLHYGDSASGVHMWQDSTYFLKTSLFSRNATTSQTSQTQCLKPNQWNSVGLTYDYNSGILKLWYEGLEISSTDIGVYQLGTNHAVRIGAVGSDSFTGSVSCVQIYDVALNQSQIEHAATLCTDNNIAIGKTATQSSTHNSLWLAPNAVDGYKGSDANVPKCTHTQDQSEPWWKVDLGGSYVIVRVRLLNRVDVAGQRLEEFQVRVGEDSDISKNSICGRTTNQLDYPAEGRSITVDCDQPIIGRYVSVQLIDRTTYLQLCEVEVFVGEGKDAGWLTLGFSSVISSAGTPHDDGGTVYDAYKTRDGNLSTYWHPTGVTDNQYFITFDLQEYYWLSKIRVIGYEEDDAATHHIAAFTIKTALNTTGSWTDVISFSGLAGRQVKAFTGFVAMSRYWRVDITQTSHGLEPYVAEIQLYGYRAYPRQTAKVMTFPSPKSTANYARHPASLSQPLTAITTCLQLRTDDAIFGAPVSYEMSANAFILIGQSTGKFRMYVNGRSTSEVELIFSYRRFLCATWSNTGNWKFYTDGTEIASGSGLAQGTDIPAGGVWILGQEQDSPGGSFGVNQAFTGEISLLNVWDRVLTEAEIGAASSGTAEGNIINWRQDTFQLFGQVTTGSGCEDSRSTGTGKSYQWDIALPMSSPLTFSVMAGSDVHIALSSQAAVINDMYEIVIGGLGNAQSVIRRSQDGENKVTVSTQDVLSSDEFGGFWISWAADGTIAAGRDGESSPFMQWQDPNPLGVWYFGYSTGWGSAGEFRFPCQPKYSLLMPSYYGFDIYKVPVTGSMLSANLRTACEAQGMQTVCRRATEEAGPEYWFSYCQTIPVGTEISATEGNHPVLAYHLCGSKLPKACAPLHDTFVAVPGWFANDGACGVRTSAWCANGNDFNNKDALCARVSEESSAAYQEEPTYHCNGDKPSYVTMATSGTITSGDDWWGNYSSDSLCSWTIEAPSGMGVSLTFLTFDLADDGDCLSDYVAVYDGSSQSSALLGRFCESNPGVVNSTGNLMHVTFVTNSVLQASGFRASFKRRTDSADECATGNGGCAQNCTNTVGSFVCSCEIAGYKLNDDGLSCDDVDECATGNGGCPQNCTNTVGSFSCSCNTGYRVNDDGISCDDIDECANANGGCEHVCTNTEGSFQCSCHLGQTLNGDGKNCDLTIWDLPESCPTNSYLSLPNNKTYVSPSDESVLYSTAQTRCAAVGGMVAVPRDSNEQEYLVFFKNCLDANAQFWLGLSRPDGTWIDSNGTALEEFAAWAPWEPDESTKLCSHFVYGLQANSERRNKWSDGSCFSSFRYICETTFIYTTPPPTTTPAVTTTTAATSTVLSSTAGAATTPTPDTCGVSAFRHVPDSGCSGALISSHRSTTLQFCASECCANPSCLSFQFNDHNECHLKSRLCSAAEKSYASAGNMYDRLVIPGTTSQTTTTPAVTTTTVATSTAVTSTAIAATTATTGQWLTRNSSWVVDSAGTTFVDGNGVIHDAAKALDGNIWTYWNPQDERLYYNNWYIVLDLKTTHTLTRIALNNVGDTTHDIANFTLQMLGCLHNWEDVLTVTNVTAGTRQRQEFDGFQETARYWRFVITHSHSSYQPWLRELDFYGISQGPYCSAGSWTDWFNRDQPSGTQDNEMLTNLRQSYPGQICATPTAVHARVTSTQQEASLAGQHIHAYDTTTGFVCRNADQTDGVCLDYEVRFCCPDEGNSVNVALGKAANQTSINAANGVASRAVDGNTNGQYSSGSCSHTEGGDPDPTWWVDLGQSYVVDRVVIFNRMDACCVGRLNPFNVHIGYSDQVSTNPKCGGDHQINLSQPSISVSCQGMLGRYVGVRLPGTGRVLTLCEVQVFAAIQSTACASTTSAPSTTAETNTTIVSSTTATAAPNTTAETNTTVVSSTTATAAPNTTAETNTTVVSSTTATAAPNTTAETNTTVVSSTTATAAPNTTAETNTTVVSSTTATAAPNTTAETNTTIVSSTSGTAVTNTSALATPAPNTTAEANTTGLHSTVGAAVSSSFLPTTPAPNSTAEDNITVASTTTGTGVNNSSTSITAPSNSTAMVSTTVIRSTVGAAPNSTAEANTTAVLRSTTGTAFPATTAPNSTAEENTTVVSSTAMTAVRSTSLPNKTTAPNTTAEASTTVDRSTAGAVAPTTTGATPTTTSQTTRLPTTTLPVINSVTLALSIPITWDDSYQDQNSTAFRELETDIVSSISVLYSSIPGFSGIIVQRISRQDTGVAVSIGVQFSGSEAPNEEQVGTVLVTAAHSSALAVGGVAITDVGIGNVTEFKTGNSSLCDSFTCTNYAVCIEIADGAKCVCEPGYEGNGTILCADIDECMTGAHVCLRDELCFNREGSYACASCYPDIALVGGGANSSAPVDIKRRVPFTVQSTVTVDCNVAYSFLFNWSLYAMDGGLPTVKIPLPENVETAGSELTLPKNVLPYGKVAIRLEVTVEETLSGLRVVTSAEQWVNVLSSALLADIAGGSAKSLARGSDIVLDGSFSTDPDAMVTDAADFIYNWTCVTESGTSCDDLFDDGGTNQSYVISSNTLEPSVRGLTVQLSVWFQDRIPGTTSQTLEVFPVGSPSISIRCFSNCNRKINPSEKLILVAECTNCEENELVSYNWTLQEAPDEFGRSDLNWDTESTTGRNLPDVVFEPEVFTALGDYTFRVEASLDYGRQGFSEYSFVPNEPPVVGSCTVSPENGTAMVTVFTFTCTGFSDSEEPLTYTFLFNTDAAAGFTPLYTGTEPTTPPQFLPVGQESRDFVVRIQAQVSDSLGATSTVETSVKVLALPAEQSTAVASQLVVGENSPLTQLVREGDAKSLVQMSNSVTSVLNTVPTNASAETRRAATEAREALVSALTTIKPSSVSSVNLVASALGSATSGGDDVSADSQVAAANSLKNMAGFLQSLPPEDLEIGQIEKSSSFMFTAVVNVMAVSSKASEKAKTSNGTVSDELEKAKKTTQDIFAAIDTMNELMLARKRPNEKPTVIQQGPFEMALQVQNCRDMRSQIVRPSENSDTWFRIPDASALFGQSCGQSVGFENYHTSLNPYSYAGNSDKIKSPVASLKFRSDSGPIGVNDLQVPIDVMMPQKPGTVVVQTERGETTPTGQDVMSMHSFNVTEADSSIHVTVTPDVEGIPVRLFLGINSAPSRQVYNWTTSLPLAVDSMYSIPLGNNSYLWPDPFQWFLSASDLGLTGSEQLFLGVDHEPFTNDTSTNDTTVRWGDLSEALELGYGGVNFTLNYTLKIFTSKCLFFENAQQQWSSDGCEVGPLTSTTLTHCLCDHLTAFGSDFQFFVAPNSLNILSALQGFANIGENPSVVITIGVLFGLYLLIVIWARWEDKKDLSKVGATVLRGAGRNSHSYQVQVFTGTRANAATSSQVFLVLRGELGQSVPYVLEDKTRITFKQGAVDTFVVTSTFHLGPIYAIHIWHNNIGPYPSWFLEQIIVTDLQEDAKHVFLCKSWLAVEEGDGKVDREVQKATDKDLTRFARLFSTKTSKDFRDGHLWFSVIGRPATSPFTRVQRISCCLSLLMCTMLTNIMFFGKGESMPKPPPVYILGFEVQFPISWGQIMIGIQSALMVIPVNLLIVQIFRNCAARPPKKNKVDMRKVPRRDPEGRASSRMSFGKHDPVLDQKSSAYEVPSGGEGTSTSQVSEKVGQQAKEQDFPHQTAVLVEEVDDVEDESYDATVMQSDQSKKMADMAKKKKKRLLPWWCVFFAWFLVLSTCSLSAFFTMLYGFEYGREKAEAWVLTFLTSFFFDLAISQPLKILLIGFIFALIIKKPDSLDDDVPPAQLYEDEEFLGPHANETEDPHKETTPEATGPPDQRLLETAREQRFIELGFRDACYDFVFYTSYILLLIIIANGNRDQYMYQMSNHLRDTFVGPFSEVNDFKTFWKFVKVNMTSDLHDVKWYNEKSLNRPGFLEDTSSFLVGHPRLRQVRVSADKSCDVPGVMAKVMTDCDRPYSLLDSDDNSYDVGWTRNNMTFDVRNWENVSDSQRPWIYQPASLSAAVPDSGDHGTYYGGGYLVELSNSSSADMGLIDELQEMDWIDDNTRAVFIEFIVYNANANLFAVFNLLAEFTNLGRAFPQGEIMVVRLYPYTTAWGFVLLGCHGLFLLVSLYLAFGEVRRILTLGTEYFKMFWRVVELVLSLLALAEIGVHLYTAYLILGFNTSQKDSNSGDERYNKYKQAASWEKINTYILGWLVCVACLKMLYLCRFNKTVQRGPKVVRRAQGKLLSFLIVFVTVFMAYSLFAYLVLGTKLTKYGSFVRTMQTLFGVMLGDMDYPTVKSAHDVLGPLMLLSFVVFVSNILIMMFLVILSDAYSDVVVEGEFKGKSENEKIKEYGVNRLRKLLHKNPNSVAITKQKSEAEISVISDMPASIPTRNIDGKSLKISLSGEEAGSENDLKQGAYGPVWLDEDWQKLRSSYANKFDEAAGPADITWYEGACGENSQVGTARCRSSTFQSRRTLSGIEEHPPKDPLERETNDSTSTGPVDMTSSVDVASGSQQSEVPPARSNSLLALLQRIRPSSFDKLFQNDDLEKESSKGSNPAGSVVDVDEDNQRENSMSSRCHSASSQARPRSSGIEGHSPNDTSMLARGKPARPVDMAWSVDVVGENQQQGQVREDRRRIKRQSTVVSFGDVELPLPGSSDLEVEDV
ncbi:uncharacterized protein LOC144911067 isoform X2 [Branchiostoma floridae x Branchiostoma belcheri]